MHARKKAEENHQFTFSIWKPSEEEGVQLMNQHLQNENQALKASNLDLKMVLNHQQVQLEEMKKQYQVLLAQYQILQGNQEHLCLINHSLFNENKELKTRQKKIDDKFEAFLEWDKRVIRVPAQYFSPKQ